MNEAAPRSAAGSREADDPFEGEGGSSRTADAGLHAAVAALFAYDDRAAMGTAAGGDGERLYRFLFDKNPHPMWVYDVDTLRFLAVNETAVLQYGYSREEFLAMTIADIRPAEDIPALLEAVGRVRTGFTASGPWRHRRRDGSILHAEIASYGMKFGDQPAELVLAVDVTDRLRAEEALKRSEEQRRFALRAAGVGTWDWDMQNDVIRWSEEIAPLHGLPAGTEIRSYEHWRSVVHPDDLARVEAAIQDAIASLGEYRIDFRTLWPDGTVRWLSSRGRVLPDPQGRPASLAGTVWDVTDRIRGEEILRQRAQEFRALAENSPDIVVRFDREFRHRYVNRAITRYTGLRPEHLIGRTNAEVGMPEPLVREWEEALRNVFATGVERTTDFAFAGPQGDSHFQSRIVPERGADGEVESLLCITRDVTAARAAEQALRQSELRYRSLVEATAAIVWSASPSGEFVGVQDDWREFTGQDSAEMAGWGWLDAVHPDDRAKTMRAWDLAVRSGALFIVEHRLWHGAGEFRHMAVRGVPIHDEAGAVREWVGIHLDVTDRVRSAQVLAQQKEALQATVAAFPDLYFRTDATGVILDFHAPRDLELAIPPSEFMGRRPRDLFPAEQAELFQSAVEEAIATRRLVSIEYTMPAVAGGVEHFEGRYVPLESAEVIAVIRNITERKVAEEARAAALASERHARQEAEQASRAKSDFLAVISHELRTPLVGVVSFAEMLEAEIGGPLTERQREFVHTISASAWHLSGLVDEILDFTRLEAGRTVVIPTTVDVRQLTDEVAYEIAPRAAAKGLGLVSHTPEEAVVVRTDPGKLRQILLNLLSNAVKFTERGEVRVELEARAEGVEIRVTDTGIGIAAELQERVFDPFWQAENPLTRREGGAGLGLAIVQRLTHLLGGAVYLESTPGSGSLFIVALPASLPAVTEFPWEM